MNKNIRMVIRTMTMLISGIMISAIILANAGSYSWFNSSLVSNMKVAAAETEDIIDTLELVYESEDLETGAYVNPTALRIRKASSFDKDPLIFFSIEGDVANYILHANPIRIESNAFYIVPIETNMNVYQYGNVRALETPVFGEIKIKYMNEYINVSKKIAFTKEFLISRLMADIVRAEVQENEELSKIKTMRFASSIEAPESILLSRKEEKKANNAIENITINAIASLAELLDWEGIGDLYQKGNTPNEALFPEGIKPSSDQELLMGIIYPGLNKYVEQLAEYVRKLRAEIEDKNAQLASLDEKMASLESQYEQLLQENAILTEQINSMTPVQPPVSIVPNTTSPPAVGGGSSGGGSSTPDVGTTPADATPTGDTGDSSTGDVDPGTGDTGDADTGTDDTGDSDTGDADTGTGDTGDSSTGDVDPGAGDTGDADPGTGGTEGDGTDGDSETTEVISGE